mmetsp:Transcript_39052/g.78840  ORF Transcript_39052/g.78840 Transcript_39052/m.78840 type:complete len:351 (+) Transcript_39052:96-1148(+)
MIIYDPRSYTDVLFRIRGSIFPSILFRVCAVALVELIAVYWSHNSEYLQQNPIPDDAHKIFGFLVGFLLVFRSTIAHKRYSEGISLLSSLQNHSLELTRKVALYCIPGTGKLGLTKDGVEDAEGAAKLRAVRDLVRRLTVQLAVLVGTDIQRDAFSSPNKSDGPTSFLGEEAEWLAIAETSDLFTADEVEAYRQAGRHYVALSARNLENALFPMFKDHFPHVNIYRECITPVKGIVSVWCDCIVTAQTPVPFPFVHLSKLFTFIFLFTLPFALVGDLGWNTIAAVLTLSTGYFGLDAIATEMEHPFGADMNDLPVAESILRLEQGTRVLMSQQEGENLQAYATRPFFNAG